MMTKYKYSRKQIAMQLSYGTPGAVVEILAKDLLAKADKPKKCNCKCHQRLLNALETGGACGECLGLHVKSDMSKLLKKYKRNYKKLMTLDIVGEWIVDKPNPKNEFRKFKNWLASNCWSEILYGDGKYDRMIFDYFMKQADKQEGEWCKKCGEWMGRHDCPPKADKPGEIKPNHSMDTPPTPNDKADKPKRIELTEEKVREIVKKEIAESLFRDKLAPNQYFCRWCGSVVDINGSHVCVRC